MLKNLVKDKKGAAMVEYALLIGGVALMAAAGVAIFGHKVSDMVGLTAAVLPGAHPDDNAPIIAPKIIETTDQAQGVDAAGNPVTGIGIGFGAIVANQRTERLGNNLGLAAGESVGNLVLEAQ